MYHTQFLHNGCIYNAMNCFSLSCVFALLHSINVVKGISEADFYPFGLQNGDSRAPTNDDGSTDKIPVSSLFPFFNHQHDSLIVSKAVRT